MDNNFNNGNGQPMQPDMNQMGYGQPMQPDMNQMGYGQPMQPDMNQMGYGQPMGMNPMPSTPPKKPKKPLGKGAIAGIISGSIVGVAAIVCGIIFIPKLFKSDREVVLEAVETTFNSYSVENVNEDYLGATEIQKKMLEKGGSSEVVYNYTISDGDVSMDLGVNAKSVIDKENKKLSSDAKITLGGEDLIAAEIYADDDYTYVSVPELIDAYFSLPNKDVLNQVMNSPLGDALKESMDSVPTMPKIDLDYFAAVDADSKIQLEDNAMDTIWDKAEFEKQGKKSVAVNGESIKAVEYTVTWTKESLQEGVKALLDEATAAVKDSEEIMKESGMSMDEFETSMEQVKAMIPSLINSDLTVKVYVKNKKAVKILCEDSVSIMGAVNFDYEFYIDAPSSDEFVNAASIEAEGKKIGYLLELSDMKNSPDGTLELYADKDKFTLELTSDQKKDGDNVSDTITIKADKYATIDISMNQSSKDHTFDGTVDVVAEGSSVATVKFDGAIENVKKGSAYSVNIKNMSVSAMGQDIMTANMMVSVDADNRDVTAFDSARKVYEITALTADSFTQIAQENQDNITNWMNRISANPVIGSLMGGASSIGEDVKEEVEQTPDSEDAAEGSDDDETAYKEPTMDDAVLETYSGNKYKTTGCLDGFKIYSAYSFMVSFVTDNYSTIAYSISEVSSAQEAVDTYFTSMKDDSDCEMIDSAYAQTTQVDGKDVLYSMESYSMFGSNVLSVAAATELESGVYEVVSAMVYPDTDNYSVEDILSTLSSKYIEKQ